MNGCVNPLLHLFIWARCPTRGSDRSPVKGFLLRWTDCRRPFALLSRQPKVGSVGAGTLSLPVIDLLLRRTGFEQPFCPSGRAAQGRRRRGGSFAHPGMHPR